MTKQEFLNKHDAIDAEMQKLRDVQKALAQDYCATAPFQKGDKVRVYTHFRGEGERLRGEAFIASVKPCLYRFKDSDFDYEFVKAKKDGTMSAQSLGIHGFSRIELIERAAPQTPLFTD